MSGWSKLKTKLDIACGCRSATEKDEDGKPLLLWDEDWRLYDIRRTVSTLPLLQAPSCYVTAAVCEKE